MNIKTAFKPQITFKNILHKFKPKFFPFENIAVIYSIPCKNYNFVYIKETSHCGNIWLLEYKFKLVYVRWKWIISFIVIMLKL